MEKPYVIPRTLGKSGGSRYVTIPTEWLVRVAKKLKLKEITKVTLELYSDHIKIIPGQNL